MYFLLVIGAINVMRWIACAANSFRSLKLQASRIRKYRAQSRTGDHSDEVLGTNFGLKFSQGLWPMAFVLALALLCRERMQPPRGSCGSAQPGQPGQTDLRRSPAPIGSNNRYQVTQYVMDSDGDHSLDLATVVEHPTGGYAQYTVQLHLASGVEQSLVVSAPAGGLQLEMHDMSGDKIPNDLVLRPTLFSRLPTVLLNDGDNHFAVAISGTVPNSLSCGQELDSRGERRARHCCVAVFRFQGGPFD